MTKHRIGTHEEWQAAREELLKEEKKLTRRNDELARKRRELPWVPVEKNYRFGNEDGMSEGTWRFSRDAPGFSQRFTGTFSDDGNTITGLSKLSQDGSTWDDDHAITYRRAA